MPHGKGTQVNADGSVYKGEYKYGKKEGNGTYTWSEKAYYTG